MAKETIALEVLALVVAMVDVVEVVMVEGEVKDKLMQSLE